MELNQVLGDIYLYFSKRQFISSQEQILRGIHINHCKRRPGDAETLKYACQISQP
jgi:hypothetical protein